MMFNSKNYTPHYRLWCFTFVFLPSVLFSLFWMSQESLNILPIYSLKKNRTPIDRNNVNSILLRTQWIRYFPALKHLAMVNRREDFAPLYNMSTSAGHSELQLLSAGNYVAGQTLVARIQTRNYFNEKKVYGGDFFIATLRPDPKSTDGIACKVFDEMDGTYGVYCFLPWIGRAFLQVLMVHPSEAVHVLMKTYRSVREPGVTMETIMINSKKVNEKTICTIGYPGVNRSDLCDYSNPKYGESWICLKPPSRECSEITWQDSISGTREAHLPSPYFKRGLNFETEIRGSGAELNVSKLVYKKSLLEKLSLFLRDDKALNLKPVGWSNHSKWTLFDREFVGYSLPRLKLCLQDKRLHLFGDSTMRQWFYHICHDLNLATTGPDNSVAWSQPRYAESQEMNLRLHYKGHGPPLHNPGPPSSHPFISNSLDEITTGGSDTIVIFGIGFHMELFDPDAYIDRLTRIKKSVVALHKRLPDVRIFIKGLYGHMPIFLCPTAWTAYRFAVILRHVFNDLGYVTFVELWDFMQLVNQRDLHPDGNVLLKQLGLVLTHIC